MDRDRFDQLARSIGARSTRRAALAAVAALGLGGLARFEGDAANANSNKAKQCGKSKPCPACHKCNKKHKCKPVDDGTACGQGATCQAGACVCPTGSFTCSTSSGCCQNGQACLQSGCGACPTVGQICSGPVPQCGQYGPDPRLNVCGCVTSVGGQNVCTSTATECTACTSDADCTTTLGVAGVCLDISACGHVGCPGDPTKICVVASCVAQTEMASRAGNKAAHTIPLRIRAAK